VAIRVGHNLVALLGRRVEADRIICRVLFGKGDLIVRSVHRAGGCKDEVAALASAYAFEYVDEGDEIAGNVFVGTGNRASYAGLRCQMKHSLEITVAEKAFHTCPICQVKGKEPESGPDAELPEPRILEPGVVVVIQVIYTNYLKAIREEPVNEVGANETSGTGDQDSFFFCLLHHFFLTCRF
jgi:hypothetical protein